MLQYSGFTIEEQRETLSIQAKQGMKQQIETL
jgi:hypothetical protein